jgi:hypothetical protein
MRMQSISYLKGCTIFLLTFLLIAGFGGAAWAATGAMGGAVSVTPSDSTPALNQQYSVDVTLFNTSLSTEGTYVGLTIDADVTSAILNLSCDDSLCVSPQNYVSYVNPGGNGCAASDPCVTSCTPIGSNQVQFNLNNCNIAPGGFLDLATVTVQQDATPITFFMRGEIDLVGTAGTCVGTDPDPDNNQCDNAQAGHGCSDDAGCDWSQLTGTGGGTANLDPEQQQQPPAVEKHVTPHFRKTP